METDLLTVLADRFLVKVAHQVVILLRRLNELLAWCRRSALLVFFREEAFNDLLRILEFCARTDEACSVVGGGTDGGARTPERLDAADHARVVDPACLAMAEEID